MLQGEYLRLHATAVAAAANEVPRVRRHGRAERGQPARQAHHQMLQQGNLHRDGGRLVRDKRTHAHLGPVEFRLPPVWAGYRHPHAGGDEQEEAVGDVQQARVAGREGVGKGQVGPGCLDPPGHVLLDVVERQGQLQTVRAVRDVAGWVRPGVGGKGVTDGVGVQVHEPLGEGEDGLQGVLGGYLVR